MRPYGLGNDSISIFNFQLKKDEDDRRDKKRDYVCVDAR